MYKNKPQLTKSMALELCRSFRSGWCCLTLVAFVYCPAVFAREPIIVRTQTLVELAIYPESATPAVVVSLNDSPIAAQIDAPVAEMPVRVGDTVKVGVVLVKLACKDFELERVRLQAEKQATQARLELADWQLKQTETLAKQQTLPQGQVQEKRSQRSVLRGDLAAQSARIASTDRQIAGCKVKAPYAGVITARLIAVGQYVTKGTPLVRLLDTSQLEISAQVPSREVTALQQAETLDFEHDGKRYPLQLRTVLPTINSETGSHEARLDFKAQHDEAGAAGRLLWRDKTMHIPADLLVKRGEQLGVFVLQDGSAHFHPLPYAQSGRPEAIELSADMDIIVSGQFALNEGDKVLAERQKIQEKP